MTDALSVAGGVPRGGETAWRRGPVPHELPGAVYRSPLIEASAERAIYRLASVGRFLVAPREATLVDAAPGATEEDISCLLRGPVESLRACLAGDFALRGAAVQVGGRAVVAFGVATGTSSLAAALAVHGAPLIADGVVPVDPGLPSVHRRGGGDAHQVTLWPDIVAALGLDHHASKVVRPGLPSRSFVLDPGPGPEEVPIGALVSIHRDYRLAASGERAVAERAKGPAVVKAILEAQWHHRLVPELGLGSAQFCWATRLATAVPAFRVRVAPDRPAATLGAAATCVLGLVRHESAVR